MKLQSILFFILISASFAYSDTLTSYTDESGKTVWTNSAQGNKERTKNTNEQAIKSTVNDINMRHPEIASDDTLLAIFIEWRDHYSKQGQPKHTAMLKAEQQMIKQGLIAQALPSVQHNTINRSRRRTAGAESPHAYSQPGEYLAYPQGGGQVLIVDAIYGKEIMILQSTGDGNYIEAVYGLESYRITGGQLIDAVYGKLIATITWVKP